MKIKSLIISILLLCMMALSVSAVTVTLNSPTNATILDSASVTFNVTSYGNTSSWDCELYTDETGTWTARETDSGVANNTATIFTTRAISEKAGGTAYNWNVFCDSTTDTGGSWGTGTTSNTSHANTAYSFGVDTTDPSITVNTPANLYWSTSGLILLNLTVVDNNALNCTLTSTMNSTSNSTQSSAAYAEQAYTNNTAFVFTGFDGIATKMEDNNTGAYTWSATCTDDAGNSGSVSSRTIWVDTTSPTAFIFNTSAWKTSKAGLSIANATTTTDYTPQIGWNMSYDLNFSRYRIRFYDTNYGNKTYVEKTITSSSTLFTNISTLVGDTSYLILITASDLAGNKVNMTVKNYKYSTDSTGRSLQSGWSVIMNTGMDKNMSDYLSQTEATTISYLNGTNEFVSHVSGGSNGGTNIPAGEAVFIYLGSAGTYTDAVWNTTAIATTQNMTNQSNTDWNIMCNRDSTNTNEKTLQDIDSYINCNGVGAECGAGSNNATNVDFMSTFDFTATSNQWTPYMANLSINNGTEVDYGACTWMFANTAVSTQEINWSAI